MNAPFYLPRGAGAVMAARVERKRKGRRSRDFFPTPPWATRALFAHVLPRLGIVEPLGTVADPVAGQGHMSEVAAEFLDGMPVIASDKYDYGMRGIKYRIDFLDPDARPLVADPDWYIMNPPFVTALDMTLLALQRARVGVAMLLRTQWVEGGERYSELFFPRPPTLLAPFVERVPMIKGRWDPDASSATSYSWFVWVKGRRPRPPFWIPPGCRESLTRPDDRARFRRAGRIARRRASWGRK